MYIQLWLLFQILVLVLKIFKSEPENAFFGSFGFNLNRQIFGASLISALMNRLLIMYCDDLTIFFLLSFQLLRPLHPEAAPHHHPRTMARPPLPLLPPGDEAPRRLLPPAELPSGRLLRRLHPGRAWALPRRRPHPPGATSHRRRPRATPRYLWRLPRLLHSPRSRPAVAAAADRLPLLLLPHRPAPRHHPACRRRRTAAAAPPGSLRCWVRSEKEPSWRRWSRRSGRCPAPAGTHSWTKSDKESNWRR